MAATCIEMAAEGDSPDKCREARRPRTETNRLAAEGEGASPPSPRRPGKRPETSEEEEPLGPGAEKRFRTARDEPPFPFLPPSSSPSTSSAFGGRTAARAPIASTSRSTLAPAESSVAFGSISLSGRSREMEDAVSVQPGFFRPKAAPPLHFFAVFDGHGGSHVSALCKEMMHVLLAEELSQAEKETADEEVAQVRKAIRQSFARMDGLALSACACGRVGLPRCGCERSGIESEIVGSTAVVALVSDGRLVVANCGDSRAVLSRSGRALPLSDDHKPDRPDELARIEAAGGRVIYLNGARVHGMLAMSRALGDKYLKPYVISEPEIRVVDRTSEDECLIIASDGLWDVLPNDLACDVARRCLEEVDPTRDTEDIPSGDGGDEAGGPEKEQASDAEKEHASDARCSLAAALLARLALARKSADNISVIVIDLRRK
ncbi:putative protein phosphatase 2C 68 [Canna indica]|uniref:protein-serine/threonine phosphatase n=1 Tax=Canna indica TaxID=4628 RepID=A0AAQ3K6U4_9LILI|nr:putative protein phosphatase 2C 68 [Canna indica]